MSKKYVIEIKPEYEDTTKGVMVLGARESNLYVDTLSIEDLEELNSDYINEHYGELQDEAYQKGFEDGKKSTEKGCEGCKYEHVDEGSDPCCVCVRGYIDHYEPAPHSDRIEVGDEVEWDGDKYVVTYLNYNIETSEITDYDLLAYDGSVVDHVKKYAFTKTGKRHDIQSILEAMRK